MTVPYSAEFKDKETNTPLLESLARQKPVGGEPGLVIRGGVLGPEPEDPAQFDTFRPTLAPVVSFRDVWPLLLLLAACTFFFDVLNRRVAIHPAAVVSPVLRWLLRRPEIEPEDQPIQRLRSRKAAIQREIEQRRAAAHFEPSADCDAPLVGEEPSGRPADVTTVPSAPSIVAPCEEEETSYTARLLEAKRRMQSLHPRRDEQKPDET